MKLVILQSNFAKALGQISRIVGTRTTLPVLSNVLITAAKGKIKFSATDLEVGITTFTIGKIEEEGALTLPARLLSDFILNNRDGSIEISTEGTIATLKSARYEATIHGIAAEEFPTVPESPKESLAKIPAKELIDALKKTVFAAATDETRPALAGIFFQFDGSTLTLAATDSYRLAEKKLTLTQSVAEKKIIVPARTMNEVMRIAGTDDGSDILISPEENQIAFKIGDTIIISRLIEGAFPPYQQIIPTDFKVTAKAPLSELLQAVKMSSLFAKDSKNNNVKISLDDKTLTVASIISQAGSANSKVPAEISGGGLEITFNARYVLDILNVLSDEKIEFDFNDGSTAGVVKSASDDQYLYIIMPVRVE